MNIVASLENMGLAVRIDDAGALAMIGLQSLSAEDRRVAVAMAKENKAAIMEEMRQRSCREDAPTPEQIAHARYMLVNCPVTRGKRHCWHCSRCDDARTCAAWNSRRSDVAFFRQSEEPYSLFLVEDDTVGVIQ